MPMPFYFVVRFVALLVIGACLAASVAAEDVPYVATPPEVAATMLKAASVGPGDVVVDLGSGDGRIPIMAVKQFGARRGIGIEINPSLVRQAQGLANTAGVADRVEFYEQNLFGYDLGAATVVTMYLLPDINLKLRPTLLALKPGTRIVSHEFKLGEWLPDSAQLPLDERHPQGPAYVYLWMVPADVAGPWRWQEGSRRIDMSIRQTFQVIHPVVSIDGAPVSIESAILSGDHLRIATPDTVYDGRVAGPIIIGVVTRADGSGGPWNAARPGR